MAATDSVIEPDGPQVHRRKPFSTWVKKLTNFKASDGERPKRHMGRKKRSANNCGPYLESGNGINGASNLSTNEDVHPNGQSGYSLSTGQSESRSVAQERPTGGLDDEHTDETADGPRPHGTASTELEAAQSITAPSHGASSLAGTSRTVGGGLESRRGDGSTFSSPAPSVRSLATTLTTIQSAGPNGNPQSTYGHSHTQNQTQFIQFSQPFPTTTTPASAIPSHLAPTGNPTTYSSATANNLLTDNASTLTLASSSKRRRRRSMDTDASVRALAPSSVWGGSRESLPLSVLSANIDSGAPTTSAIHGSGSRMGAERNSIYSATGIAPALASERNSLYTKQGDGASIRSGLLGHGRTDSGNGGNATMASPLATPLETPSGTTSKSDKAHIATPRAKDDQ